VYKGMSCRKDGSEKLSGALVWAVCQWFANSLGSTLSSSVDSKATGLEGAGKEGIHVGLCLSR
jgi:hypothetical protein